MGYGTYYSRFPSTRRVPHLILRKTLFFLGGGTVIGKAEGSPHDFHGHVTALTVAPEYRRLSLARSLMNFLETVSDDVYGGLFVDLYVRCTNSIAIDLYEGLGYSVYRRVREYYGSLGLGHDAKDEEDAFGSYLRNKITRSFSDPACLNRHAQTPVPGPV